MQLRLAAEAVVALKEKVFEGETKERMQLQFQHAAEVLAAQIPRLELYASINVRLNSRKHLKLCYLWKPSYSFLAASGSAPRVVVTKHIGHQQ